MVWLMVGLVERCNMRDQDPTTCCEAVKAREMTLSEVLRDKSKEMHSQAVQLNELADRLENVVVGSNQLLRNLCIDSLNRTR